MKRRFVGLTDTGIVRTVNQDSYYVDDPQGRFFIVADGMGGHAGGQEASKIATKTIQSHLEDNWDNADFSSEALLKEAIEKANQDILDDQSLHPERADMGTTVVAIIFRDRYLCGHVGDSRLYRLRDSSLEQITEDHTWVGMAIKSGEISKDQAHSHPYRHVLSQCLGRKDLMKIDISEIDIKPGDLHLICSDGLTEEVRDEKIADLLSQGSNCSEQAINLISAAKEAGGSDNITVVLIVEES